MRSRLVLATAVLASVFLSVPIPAAIANPVPDRIQAAAAAQPDSATSGHAPVAVYQACPAGVPAGTRCGTVAVPLDRSLPHGRRINIAFQFTPATDTRTPAISTIVASNGGPGNSNIDSAPLWLSFLAPVLNHHNFLAIDHRGIGASAPIDCPALQHVQGDQAAAARACGQQLGADAYRYGSGDVAQDVEAVREALNAGRLDYYGVSYGSVDVRAYAYRYPQNLRSAVLDSPYNSQDAAFTRDLPTAMARITELVCQRSTSCHAAYPDPARVLDQLISQVRQHPFTGVGKTADGQSVTVRVDENAILKVLYNDYFSAPTFLNQGEIFAAATALRRGDRVPLLRLVAQSPSPTDFGPSDGSTSVGADYAVFCADSVFPWNKYAPEPVRERQYRAALARIPQSASAPFSIRAWTGFVASQPVLLIPGADACVPWPSPVRPTAPFPVNQPFPASVPALVLGGQLDYLDLKGERELMPLIPNGTFVPVANAGHVTTFWNPCATSIAVTFLATLSPGNTSCAGDPNGAMGFYGFQQPGVLQLQGVGRFPARAADEIPARPASAADRGHWLDRKVAAVTVATVQDAIYTIPRLTGPTGVGLRGGSFAVTASATARTVTYRGSRFARDVAVSGRAVLQTATAGLTASVSVAGPCGSSGRLTITATMWNPAHPWAHVTGTLGGRHIDELVAAR